MYVFVDELHMAAVLGHDLVARSGVECAANDVTEHTLLYSSGETSTDPVVC